MLHLRGDARRGSHSVMFEFRLPGPSHARGLCRLVSMDTSYPPGSLELGLKAEWTSQRWKEFALTKDDVAKTSPKLLSDKIAAVLAENTEFSSVAPSLTTPLANEDAYRISLQLPPGLTMAADTFSWKALGMETRTLVAVQKDNTGKLIPGAATPEIFALTNNFPVPLNYESRVIDPTFRLPDLLGKPYVPPSGLRYIAGRMNTSHERLFRLSPNTMATNASIVEILQKCFDEFKQDASLKGDISVTRTQQMLKIATKDTDCNLTVSVNGLASKFFGIGGDSFSLEAGSSAFTTQARSSGHQSPSLTPFSGFEPPAMIISDTHQSRSQSYVQGRGVMNVLATLDTNDRVSAGTYFDVDNRGQFLNLSFVDGFLQPLKFEDDFVINLTCGFKPLY